MKPIADMIRSTPVAGYVGCCYALPKINLTDRLKEIKAPVLALTGTEDASAASTKTIHESIPGSAFVAIPSASHIANIEQPEAFNAALDEVLRPGPEVSARARSMGALAGQHAVVTGGGRGMGAAALAGEGATVSVLGRDAARLAAEVM